MTVTLGKYSYGNIVQRGEGTVTVGKFCSIASGVKAIFLNDHRVDWITTFPFLQMWKMSVPNQKLPPENIVVGNDAWLGTDVTLLGGANIGDGAVVGAYSVVSGKVAPYSIVVGNPAKLVRKRFSEKDIQSLLRIKWWDWPDEKIKEVALILSSDRIFEFIKRNESNEI